MSSQEEWPQTFVLSCVSWSERAMREGRVLLLHLRGAVLHVRGKVYRLFHVRRAVASLPHAEYRLR